MKFIKSVLLISFLTLSVFTTGQSKSEIIEKGIESRIVYELFIEEGMKEPVIEEKEVYNERGELLELIQYNNEGEITKWEKFSYDEDGNLIEQVFLNRKGKVEKKEVTLYKDGLRTERQFFDSRDRMYKKKIYEYAYRKENP